MHVPYFECANFRYDIGFRKCQEQIPKYGHFESNSITFLILTKILPDFKSDICFRKFRTQIPKFEHFEPKTLNFFILTKFSLYAISKVLI